ncbi:MAG: SDR family oxidoreductase [Minicystis sp.]
MRFDEKTAIVTGASEGIGFAIAAGLAAEGARVVLVARREELLAEAARKLGPRVSYVAGDASLPETADRAVAAAIERYGSLDLLACNAGVLLPGPVMHQPMEQIDTMLGLNLRGPIAFVRAATPRLAGRPGASILLISSATSRLPLPHLAVYGATKAALNYLTQTWAVELASAGIRVNALSPGGTYTPAFHAVAEVVPGLEQGTIATNLIKRIATAEEVARLGLLLLDDRETSYVTGSIWDADGGYQRGRFL